MIQSNHCLPVEATTTLQAQAVDIAPHLQWLKIESIDLEAQGIAHRADGKVVFVDGALVGEWVRVNVFRKKNNWEQAQISERRGESSQRVSPACPYFGLCGGCKMQHLHSNAQVAVKQRALEDNLWHLGKVKPERWLPAIHGPTWGYRFRARLSVRFVVKKNVALVGFHERKSRYVADMKSCEILPPHISTLLMPLRELIGSMDQRDGLPQIEVAVGSNITALVLRHMNPLTAEDIKRLKDFASLHNTRYSGQQQISWWLQPKGPDTAHSLEPEMTSSLYYTLPEFGIIMPFKPTDFTQVNHAINQVLVGKTLRLLKAQCHDRIIDWFCGLGNFTLPLATQASNVLGIEGSESLIARAKENALFNKIQTGVQFQARDIFQITANDLAALGTTNKWLVDPPREGAFALIKALADICLHPSLAPDWIPPQRIVYVSCNPSTLARDAGLLVHQAGYRCTMAGAINMFPHTGHVESIAVFERI